MKKALLLFIALLFIVSILEAQRGNKKTRVSGGNKIIGKVIDSSDSKPIEYSNLVLLMAEDSTQITGTITNDIGEFLIDGIRPNEYLLKISFIGYESEFIENIKFTGKLNVLDLGIITLTPIAYELDGATVIANKSPVEYHIDKKVINVSGQNTSISGSAVEVLENVPSVEVDIEGNVSLRGSGSFTLLIDGRPTILDPNDALQQIPASTIENIEIVTNPSAKFDPEGVSGIINIIMKKRGEYVGVSGIVNVNVGLDEKYSGDVLASYKTNGYSFYLGGDYRNHKYPGTGEERRITFNDGFDSYLNSTNTNSRFRKGYNFSGGADLIFDQKNALGLSFRYGDRSGTRNSNVNFHEFTIPFTTEEEYKNISEGERGGDRFSSSINYKLKFDQDKHEISADISYQKRNGEEYTLNEYYDEDGLLTSGRKNTEDGPSERIRAKLDYSLPLGELSYLEAGIQSEIGQSEDDSKSFIIDENNNYLFQDEFSYLVNYDRNIHSIYSIFNSKIKKFGYQLGLRTEYTDRLIKLSGIGEKSTIKRWDYFPTIHTSYSLNELVQFMASYTKRIRRPRGYYLEPFLTWEDQNNVRRGDPDIEPEYINSFEVAYQTHIDEVILSIETYYRERKNKIERIRSLYDTDVTLTTVANVGKDQTLGTEFMVDADLFKIWNLTLLGNLSQYKLEGNYNGNDFSRDNFNWSLRLNSTFNISENTKLQFNGRYSGPSVSAQAEYEGYFSADLSVKQNLWQKKLALTLQIRDIFQTSKREGTTFGQGFESYTLWERKSPVVMLNISLNLNNFKQKRDRSTQNGREDLDEEF